MTSGTFPLRVTTVQGRAEGTTGIVRRRLYKHVLEEARAQDLSVESTIVRHAARKAQVLLPGDLFEMSEDVKGQILDRKSTRLNSSHVSISYAVFCLKKK